jgi:hypothetical protein
VEEPVATESALLHHPFRSDGDISIEGTFHLSWPFRGIPVKVFDGIRTSSSAVPTTNTSVIDLTYKSFLIDIGRIDRADLGAWRVITMHAGSWEKPDLEMRVLSLNIRDQFDPVNGSASCCFLWSNDRYIIFRLAGDHTSLASRAFI